MTEPKKGGRRTKEQEIDLFLAGYGMTRTDLAALTEGDEAIPATFAEMRDGFTKAIWKQKDTMKGTALTQALTALARLAEANKGDDEAKTEAEPTVAEVMAGIGQLTDEQRNGILTRALARLDEERKQIMEALHAV